MKEWLSWVGGATAWGLTLWMAKKYFEAKVFDVVNSAKKKADEAIRSNEHLTDKINKFANEALIRTISTHERIDEALKRHDKLFFDAVQFSTQAKTEVAKNHEELRTLRETTEIGSKKLNALNHALVEQLKSTRTEVTLLKNNLVLLKSTVEKKK